MLGDCGVADDYEVARTRGEAVDRPFLAEPLEEREEERAPEEVPHVVELGGRDGDPRAVSTAASPADQRAGQRREPVGTDPRGGGLVVVAAAAPWRGQTEAGVARMRPPWDPRLGRSEGGSEGERLGGHRAGRRGVGFGVCGVRETGMRGGGRSRELLTRGRGGGRG